MEIGVVKRLAAAEGYLELDMPQYALDELLRLAKKYSAEQIGQFSPIVNLLHGRVLMAIQRYDEAINQLKRASIQLAPHNKLALFNLERCYRLNGQLVFADHTAKMLEDSEGDLEPIFNVQSSTR